MTVSLYVVPPQELQTECAICLHIIREPYLVSCCGYRFSRVCIENVEEEAKKTQPTRWPFDGFVGADCPLCKNRFKTLPDKFFERKLKEKLVYCQNKDHGCVWIGLLNHYDEHLNVPPHATNDDRFSGCDYVQLNCSYCEDLIERHRMANHESSCPKRPISCTYCLKYTSTADDVRRHWERCPSFPIFCTQGCGVTCKRIEMKDHIAQSCPLTQIKCQYFDIGCKTEVRQADMAEHMQLCMSTHVTVLDRNCEKLKKELKQVSEDGRTLRNTYTAAITKLSRRVEQLSVENKQLKLQSVKEPLEETSTVVHVTNCPPNTNEQKLRSLFGPFGQVRSVQWEPLMCYAFIHYPDNDCVKRALNHHRRFGTNLHKTKLQVQCSS